MASKAELLDQAREQGLDVKTSTSKKELESMLASDTNSVDTSVTVNDNTDGEATNGTVQDGSTNEVKNGENIPQNGITETKTTAADSTISTQGDEARTEEETKYADESNPNNKARVTGAGGSLYDQDGNLRTGGKSYGVADDSNNDVSQDVFNSNRGEEPDRQDNVSMGEYLNPEVGSDADSNAREWSLEDQTKLADSLSEPDNGIKAVVSTSAGDYVRVKFIRNGLAFGTYKSRAFTEAKAKQYLSELKESRGL